MNTVLVYIPWICSIYFTLEEYFRDNARTEFPEGCSSIAEYCLTYLNSSQLRQHCTNIHSLKEIIIKYPFLKYAALHWGTYAKQQFSDGVTQLGRMLVEHESERLLCTIQALFLQTYKSYPFEDKVAASRFSGIHAAAYFGLSDIVANFCEVEIKDEIDRTPLSWAAEYGHEDVVRLLLEKDSVDINSRDIFRKIPLTLAAENGHEAIVRLLLGRVGVDINPRDIFDRMIPLIWAAKNGNESVVQLMLRRQGIVINAKDAEAFILAAQNGDKAVVRLLIEKGGFDVNSRDDPWFNGKTPLIWAAENGNEAVVRLLLEREDTDINAKGGRAKSPLIWAVLNDCWAVVPLLLEKKDFDINAKKNTP